MGTRLIAAALALALPAQAVQAQSCNMAFGFAQPDRNGDRTVAVWQDPQKSALLFADTMNVNTDGTRRSYSVIDFWGEATTGGAINNLCNAMSDACAGLDSEQLKARRILTQKARDKGWPADLLARTRISSSIIPFRSGKPCPEVGGYLVSATALHKVGITDQCDIDNYVDSDHVGNRPSETREEGCSHPFRRTRSEDRGPRCGRVGRRQDHKVRGRG